MTLTLCHLRLRLKRVTQVIRSGRGRLGHVGQEMLGPHIDCESPSLNLSTIIPVKAVTTYTSCK